MIDYGVLLYGGMSVAGAWGVSHLAKKLSKRMKGKYKSVPKFVNFLATFMTVAYSIAEVSSIIHQSGAPTIFMLGPLALFGVYYWRHFKEDLRTIRPRMWRMWFKYVFVMGCMALAPIVYFLLAFSVLELQYNILPSL
ncbi:hypothetical protein [Candidatus Nitrososphaera evergladensis]|uniref:hypothetical protein n=1 Tax=Candidatus Nitrososphaera evergladensis TaxID=1459637 RepID=UPI0011E5FF2E|nr:hypothetical protein [Candidatus Nitrososphaera evergladensis]